MITSKIVSSPIGAFNWVQYTPDAGAGPWPVLIMIPGNGETGNDGSKAYVNGPFYFLKNIGWKPNMVIVFAQTPYQGGTYGNPAALPFMRAVMHEIANGKYPVDITKIYLTGLSYGSDHVTYYMQKEDPAYYIPVAAIAPMSMNIYGSIGNYPNDTFGGNDSRFLKCPIWGFCGTQDSFYQPMHKFVTQLASAAGVKTKWTEWAGGHSGWNQFYNPTFKQDGMNVEDWLSQYSTAVIPPVATPPPVVVPAPKTIKSILITYSDGSTEQKP